VKEHQWTSGVCLTDVDDAAAAPSIGSVGTTVVLMNAWGLKIRPRGLQLSARKSAEGHETHGEAVVMRFAEEARKIIV
jgi:hypothetical protein